MPLRRTAAMACGLGLSLVLALGTSVLAADATPSAQPATTPSADGAPAGLTVKDVTFLGPVSQNSHVAARDNGQSVEYQGKSYWFFDDTILTNPAGFLSSTSAVTTDLDAADGITLTSASLFDPSDATGTPSEFVPYSAAETAFQNAHAATDCTGSTDEFCGTQFAFWPGAAVADPAHHRILVFYGKLCRGGLDTGPCASGFVGQELGTGIVSVDMRTHTASRMTIDHQDPTLTSPEGADPTLQFSPGENWGTGGAVLVGQELYSYGDCSSTDACGVARVPIGEVQDRAAWTFYDGIQNGRPVWGDDPATAVAVMTGGAAGETVQYDPATGQYMNTYMPFLSDEVLYQTAPHPWGPWSTPQKMFDTPTSAGSTEYAAFAHPEYTTNHGLTRYFTYYTSSTGAQMLVKVDFTKR